MKFFTEIPEAQAIVHARGVYRQVPLYGRGDQVFAKYGSGFVRLSTGGATSATSVRWSEFDAGLSEIIDKDGAAPKLVEIYDRPKVVEAAE